MRLRVLQPGEARSDESASGGLYSRYVMKKNAFPNALSYAGRNTNNAVRKCHGERRCDGRRTGEREKSELLRMTSTIIARMFPQRRQ